MTDTQGTDLLQQAIAALQGGIPGQARAILESLTAQGADTAAVWGVLALACRDQEDMPAALEAAERSLTHEARNPRALVVKGDAYYKLGDRQASAAFYREALKLLPARAQLASDMAGEMDRARTRVETLAHDFADHLSRSIGSLIENTQEDSIRMKHTRDLLLGKRQIFYPEPKQIHFPGLPLIEFADPGDFDWIPTVEAAFEDIRSEAGGLLAEQAEFGAYLTADGSRPAYDLHGLKNSEDWGAFYLWYNGEPVKENQARCPKTTEVMENLPLVFSGKRCPNVLFSRLKPGSRIPPHHGMINTRLICHLPLIVPRRCGFRVGNDVREWVPGKVWLFDDTVEHEAWNDSDEDRILLIFEVWKPGLTDSEKNFMTRLLEAVDAY
jgi:aspartyl/asparaginyl beta-hydroxylase (cupin superfamily)